MCVLYRATISLTRPVSNSHLWAHVSFAPVVGHLAVKLSLPVQATLKVMMRSGFEH